jgi:hypothetical protein
VRTVRVVDVGWCACAGSVLWRRHVSHDAARSALGRTETKDVFVNTTEKSQGMTASLVIVCYGVCAFELCDV